MTVQLIVDPDVCIGSGECVATDPTRSSSTTPAARAC